MRHVTGLLLDWRLIDLMAVYWVQSVIIGASCFARILWDLPLHLQSIPLTAKRGHTLFEERLRARAHVARDEHGLVRHLQIELIAETVMD